MRTTTVPHVNLHKQKCQTEPGTRTSAGGEREGRSEGRIRGGRGEGEGCRKG